jgi:hypothetical protein
MIKYIYNMPKESMPEKISNEIPEELVKLIESEDTALEIARICFENGIKEEEKIRKMGYQTGRVLLGDLPPEKFQESLEKEVKISPFLAGKIAREINDSIFYSVRESLATLYKTEIVPAEKSPTRPSEEKPEAPKRVDTYRESI